MTSFVTNHREPYATLSSKLAHAPLSSKSVFITGAGRGVGEFITQAVIEAGAKRVGILGRNKERIDSARAKLNSSAFVQQDIRKWWEGFEINILGTAIVTQQFLKAKGQGNSAIVLNVSSMAAHMRFPLSAWSGYVGSKMGQARIFEYIRFEHIEVRFVNCHPGQIQTDGFATSKAEEPPWGMTDGKLAGEFFAWLATDEADILAGRFVWAEWDIDELIAKKDEILEKDLLLMTVDGLKGVFM